MLSALRDDALTSIPGGFAVRVGLPWIRSLSLACVREVAVAVDGHDLGPVTVRLSERLVSPERLIDEAGWWFTQDRLVVEVPHRLAPGRHDVVVTLRLLIPYLMAGPGGGPLELPIRLAAELELDREPLPSVSLDVA